MPLSLLLTCEEEHWPSARDLSSFLWDMTMLHDRIIIFEENPTDPILHSPNFYRRWRRLPRGLELKLGLISKQSPLTIELIVGTAGGLLLAAKTFAEILHLIRDWSLEREKKKLENLQHRIEILEKIEGLRKASPELLILLDKDIHRLMGNQIRILEVKESEIVE